MWPQLVSHIYNAAQKNPLKLELLNKSRINYTAHQLHELVIVCVRITGKKLNGIESVRQMCETRQAIQ